MQFKDLCAHAEKGSATSERERERECESHSNLPELFLDNRT